MVWPVKYGVQRQVGWLFENEIIEAIQSIAKEQGVRPGKLATRLIKTGLAREQQPLNSIELARRIRFPAELSARQLGRFLR